MALSTQTSGTPELAEKPLREMQTPTGFRLEKGIYVAETGVAHRDEEYDPSGFDILLAMQRTHFWYLGRGDMVLRALRHALRAKALEGSPLCAVDLGGGCGGWLEFLHERAPHLFRRLALGDSSLRALELAEPVVGSFAERCQADMLALPWCGEWDVVFLLDVIEHIEDHEEVLRQVEKSLRPGGLCFVTVPAFQCFRTYNDDLARHKRRYRKKDVVALAAKSGLSLVETRYFMFFLSPALLLSRWLAKPSRTATEAEQRAHLARTHSVPPRALNLALEGVFKAETRLGEWVPLPWGTSLLAVFEKKKTQ